MFSTQTRRGWHPLFVTVFSGWSLVATASSDLTPAVDDYMSFLASANSYSPAEGAGSHGSVGIGFGAGASTERKPTNSALIDDQLRSPDQFANDEASSQNDTIVIPRAFFHKGLPWPVDFGFGLGRIPNLRATTAGGYAQWTVYEAFALPAVALRLKHSRMMGLPSTEFNTTAMEGAVSYGFLRYFTAYGTYAFNRNEAVIRTSGESGTSLSLSDNPSADFHTTRNSTSRTYGIQIQALPPFCNVAIENRLNGNQSSYMAKLSLGL